MPLILGRSGAQYAAMVTKLLSLNCRVHLVESYCKESNISDKNWLRYPFSSYLVKVWLSVGRHHLANWHRQERCDFRFSGTSKAFTKLLYGDIFSNSFQAITADFGILERDWKLLFFLVIQGGILLKHELQFLRSWEVNMSLARFS